MNLHEKEKLIVAGLQETELLEFFTKINEDAQSIVYSSNSKILGSPCEIYIFIEESIFNTIYFRISLINYKYSQCDLLNMINKLNKESSFLIYFIDEDSINAKLTYISTPDYFNAEAFCELIILALQVLNLDYEEIITNLV